MHNCMPGTTPSLFVGKTAWILIPSNSGELKLNKLSDISGSGAPGIDLNDGVKFFGKCKKMD